MWFVAMVIGSLASVPVAHATPSSGISAVTVIEGEIPAELIPLLPLGVHAVVREITIAPGGSTGWHYHDGPVFGFVRAGILNHPGPDCAPVVYHAGQFIEEPSGTGYVHMGQNLGTQPVILDVVYAVPVGKPLLEDALAPACA
ncbi:cupin domain-containing protein [Skermania sp. ID1734]|uniref:cupin domain-containing protein n=1 Tax=Skermania sp. ID1734 TaxID=2597516 RepID=UPI00117E8D85|nr:cupin domain-containing protein [Skermania sp. ID1734]TSD97302.1 cupin domain-containing protein [Skermania sp. ID1734]